METGKAVYHILNNADLAGSATVHPEVAPEGTAFPFVVYSIQNIRPSDVKDTTSKLDESTLEIFIMSDSYPEAMNVAADVRDELDRNAGSFNGVEVQSINFDTAEISYNEPQECYMVEQIYTMRVLLVGQAPAADLLPLNASSIRIEEIDLSPQAYCTVLKFPNGSLSIDSSGGAGSGIATYSPVYEMATFSVASQYMMGGANAVDYSSSTPAVVQFTEEDYTSAQGINTNAGGRLYVETTGIYRVSVMLSFNSDTHGHSPHFYFEIEDSKQAGEAGAMIPAQHNVDHQPSQLTRVLPLTDAQRLAVYAFDESNKGGAVYIDKAVMDVERMA